MITLSVLFWIFTVLFIFIGAMRGWAKELLVTFSGILAIFIISVILPLMNNNLQSVSLFWAQFIIIFLCVFFGYQTPNFRRIAESGRFTRNQVRDVIMGALIGGVNGYVIFGSIWHYMAKAGYPFPFISAPDASTEAGEAALEILNSALPSLLTVPTIYYAITVGCIIILVIFI